MPANLQLLKRRIKTSQNIAQIAKAMETISASKIKKAQDAATGNKPYAQKILELASKAMSQTEKKKFSHQYINLPKNKKKLYIIISPDKGLCGGLNTNLYKKIMEVDSSKTLYITLGKKAQKFAAKLEGELFASFPLGSTLPSYAAIIQIKSLLDELILKKEISEAHLLFAEFESILTQKPITGKLLPLELEQISDEITLKEVQENDDAIFEPDAESFLLDLLPQYVETQIYNSLLQAYTSEQAARMMAMQNAKNNAFDIADYLTLVYNKSRQERITNEILDLTNSQY